MNMVVVGSKCKRRSNLLSVMFHAQHKLHHLLVSLKEAACWSYFLLIYLLIVIGSLFMETISEEIGGSNRSGKV